MCNVPEATPTGAHILHAAGLQETDDVSLLAILADGEFEEVLLHQAFDLHHRGVDRFVAFRTDRLFKLTLNGRLIQWGKPLLDGSVLYGLAGIGEDEAVFLETAEGGPSGRAWGDGRPGSARRRALRHGAAVLRDSS